jgi:hypothetical protein
MEVCDAWRGTWGPYHTERVEPDRPTHHESHEEDRSRTARPEECHRRRGGNEARRLLCRGEGVWVGREAGVGDEGFGGEAHGGSEG